MSTPAIILNSSPAVAMPMPGDAMLTLRGLALAVGDEFGDGLGGTTVSPP